MRAPSVVFAGRGVILPRPQPPELALRAHTGTPHDDEFRATSGPMSDDDFDDDDVEEDLEELEDIDGDIEDDELDLDDDLDDDGIDAELDGDAIDGDVAPAPGTPVTDEDDDEEGLDLDEELHPDDVEAPLDALLQERTAKATLEDEEEEVEDDEVDVDERGEGTTRIVPRRPGEFLCQSCFLVLPRHMLADEERMLCQDCV